MEAKELLIVHIVVLLVHHVRRGSANIAAPAHLVLRRGLDLFGFLVGHHLICRRSHRNLLLQLLLLAAFDFRGRLTLFYERDSFHIFQTFDRHLLILRDILSTIAIALRARQSTLLHLFLRRGLTHVRQVDDGVRLILLTIAFSLGLIQVRRLLR